MHQYVGVTGHVAHRVLAMQYKGQHHSKSWTGFARLGNAALICFDAPDGAALTGLGCIAITTGSAVENRSPATSKSAGHGAIARKPALAPLPPQLRRAGVRPGWASLPCPGSVRPAYILICHAGNYHSFLGSRPPLGRTPRSSGSTCAAQSARWTAGGRCGLVLQTRRGHARRGSRLA